MTRGMSSGLKSGLGLLAACGVSPSAMACATCFGASDSALAKGMNFGIMSLLLVVLAVLGGVASFFVYLARRSASMPAEATEPSTSLEA